MGTEPDDEGDPSPTAIECGDAVCDLVESCDSCTADCGVCSDGVATPTRETAALFGDGDANDPAIWIHPSDSALSLIIGTAEDAGGLRVYDLRGVELQATEQGDYHNVDLRYGFSLGGDDVALVVAGASRIDAIVAYRVDAAQRRIANVSDPIRVGFSVYGTCLYHSRATGELYAIVTSRDGEVEQWRLMDDGTGGVRGDLVRAFEVGSKTEGCAADDALGALYLAEEDVGIWRYGAEPSDGDARVLVDDVGGEHLTDDIEGLTLYVGQDERGYLIASSQSRDEYVVYRRSDNEYVATFSVVDGAEVDGCEDSVGVDVAAVPLGDEFPFGVFVATDDDNTADGGTNFKLVPWDLIAEATGGLSIDVGEDPRR